MTIKFYSTFGKYGAFSNFSRHSVVIDHKRYKTTEHFYQAQKFIKTDKQWANKIAKQARPSQAASLGRDKSRPLRKDWESVKVDVMRRALRAKVEQYSSIEELLLSTGDRKIIENSPKDAYWGVGPSGRGKNMLGRLWMELREQLRAAGD